jgi:hypothetical protein
MFYCIKRYSKIVRILHIHSRDVPSEVVASFFQNFVDIVGLPGLPPMYNFKIITLFFITERNYGRTSLLFSQNENLNYL